MYVFNFDWEISFAVNLYSRYFLSSIICVWRHFFHSNTLNEQYIYLFFPKISETSISISMKFVWHLGAENPLAYFVFEKTCVSYARPDIMNKR